MIFNNEIAEIDETVIKPLYSQMVYKFIYDLGLEKTFDGNVYINSSNMASSSSDDNNNRPKVRNDKFECVARSVLNPSNMKWDNNKGKNFIGHHIYLRQENRSTPVFKDDDYGITMYEHGTPCNLVVACKLSFMNKLDADVTMSKIFEKYKDTGMIIPSNDMVYDYSIPFETFMILYMLFKMTKQDPLKFLHYLREKSANRISVNVNRNENSKDIDLIVQKNMTQALVSVDFDQDEAEVESNAKSPNLYIVNFTLTLQFLRPSMNILDYPVTVFNQFVPKDIIPVEKNGNLPFIDPTYTDIAFDNIAKQFKLGNTDNPVIVPWYDDWRPTNKAVAISIGYKPFFITAFTLDEYHTTIDLKGNLAGLKIDADVLEALRIIGDRAIYSNDKYNITIFVNEYMLEPKDIRLVNGTEITIFNVNKKARYHLVVSEIIEPSPGPLNRCYVFNADIIAELERRT